MQTLRIAALLNTDVQPELQWIEVSSSLQIPGFHIVGLPGPEVSEARERVRAAVQASELEFPRRRVVLNLTPASVRKQGTGSDLAMAIAILLEAESYLLPLETLESTHWVAIGELGLDGSLKPTGQITRSLLAAWRMGATHLFIPASELEDARLAQSLLREAEPLLSATPPELVAVENLKSAWRWVLDFMQTRRQSGEPTRRATSALRTWKPIERKASTEGLMSLSPAIERILGVSVAGLHHLLMIGPRGVGKSHALEWLSALFPPHTAEQTLSRTLVAELGTSSRFSLTGSIRRVGTQARPAALIGSANAHQIRPGEYSLAHGGLLIADELPEWPRDSRETLREPLERGWITLTRARGAVELPARFMLAANGNFCPCGGWPTQLAQPSMPGGKRGPRCHCSAKVFHDYWQRLSGPVLDRIDLILRMNAPTSHVAVSSADIQDRVVHLRTQVAETRKRSEELYGMPCGLLPGHRLEELLNRHPDWRNYTPLQEASSLRSRHKILRSALTLALWDGNPLPAEHHFLEASLYRMENLGVASRTTT